MCFLVSRKGTANLEIIILTVFFFRGASMEFSASDKIFLGTGVVPAVLTLVAIVVSIVAMWEVKGPKEGRGRTRRSLFLGQ